MRTFQKFGFTAAAVLLASLPAASQMQMGMSAPDFRGVFNPTVGSGAAYQIESKAGKNEMEITIVGKEDVAGKTGYWVEMAINAAGKGDMYVKNLMVIDAGNGTISRMIIQAPGSPPMDMTSMMSMNRAATQPHSTDVRAQAERVGTETITTPAGTFECEHYKAKDGSWEAWLSSKVTPWGLVKSTGKDATMMLTRTITNATDHITGTPQKMDMGEMMRRAGQQPSSR